MDDIERVARGIIAEASPRVRDAWLAAERKIEYKSAIDLVTATDREIEALITERLHAAFPDHLVIGEEASGSRELVRPPAGRFVWYVDPLDGTTNFAHTFPCFAISLGLARGSELLFGIVNDPVRDETFVAARGRGAVLNERPIRVSRVPALDQALLGTGFPYDRRENADFYLAFLKDFMLRTHGIRRLGAAALDLCAVACGRLDGFWEWKLHPWDTAAGAVIVREAGGTITTFSGADYDLYSEQTLASNGAIHGEMIEVLQARLRAGSS